MKPEAIRQLHEDIDRNVEEIIVEQQHVPKSHRNRMQHEHFISSRLESIRTKRRRLIDTYVEAGNAAEETCPLSNTVEEFYNGVQEIEDYHRKFPGVPVEKPKAETPHPDQFATIFSGEEGYGRYLDMHSHYTAFMALPFAYDTNSAKGKSGSDALVSLRVQFIAYTDWLENCTKFSRLPRNGKNLKYKEYLQTVLDYLTSFYTRSHPLMVSAEKILADAKDDFAAVWSTGNVPGWEDVADINVEGRKPTKKERQQIFHKSVACLEHLVSVMYDLLKENKNMTLAMLERKETKSKEEIDAETQREVDEAQAIYEERYGAAVKKAEKVDEDDFPEIKSNPKNLPIGFDGQPIPHWLFKLHGLKEKFKCEICRDFSYVGPLAFDKHFQEARHAHGMRCLGIPNTAHFHHVTGVQEALALWRKLKADASHKQWDSNRDWEFEDAEGHVFNKSTRDDMRRHGLLS